MSKPKVYPDVETYRREYNSRPEVKERNKIHNLKWKSKPEVQAKLRVYNREYMRSYWVNNPEKYKEQKIRIAELNRVRIQEKKIMGRLRSIT
jgi:hypothetical protein